MDPEEVARIGRIADPMERARAAAAAVNETQSLVSDLATVRKAALRELIVGGMKQTEIAKALGVSGAVISRMLSDRTKHPERGLIAPDAPNDAAVTIIIVQRKEGERGHRTRVESTQKAIDRLRDIAAPMELHLESESVPIHEAVDLNRDRLLVLMGPRVSDSVAEAIKVDPVIKWRQDGEGRWFIIDTSTWTEYHSDFDHLPPGSSGHCVAHIGRLRRPDGNGSFLYLGGAHAEGTAGAVDLFIQNLGNLWEQANRSLWSAVVRTEVNDQEEITEAELVTPIYVHGKR
jgi:hypothetical protein